MGENMVPGIGAIIRSGAENGLWIGGVYTLSAVSFFLSLSVPFTSLLVFPLLFAVIPVAVWRLIRIGRISSLHARTASLWMAGIVMFICGALIACLVSAIWMLYIHPGFLSQYMDYTMQLIRQSDMQMPQESIRQLEMMASTFPSPMKIVDAIFWSSSFIGSIISLVLALILPRTKYLVTKPLTTD